MPLADDYKAIVRVACVATANVTIATALNPGDVVGGRTLVQGDLILLAGQTAGKENGLYRASEAPQRDINYASYLTGGNSGPDAAYDLFPGMVISDEQTGFLYHCTSLRGGQIDVTALVFTSSFTFGSITAGSITSTGSITAQDDLFLTGTSPSILFDDTDVTAGGVQHRIAAGGNFNIEVDYNDKVASDFVVWIDGAQVFRVADGTASTFIQGTAPDLRLIDSDRSSVEHKITNYAAALRLFADANNVEASSEIEFVIDGTVTYEFSATGIGEFHGTNPALLLHVTAGADHHFTNSGGNLRISADNNNEVASTLIEFMIDGATVGSFTAGGAFDVVGGITAGAGNAFTLLSDGNFTITNTGPSITLTDSDTGADCRVSASSTAGSLYLEADRGNVAANSAINFWVDNSQVGTISATGAMAIDGSFTAVNAAFTVGSTGDVTITKAAPVLKLDATSGNPSILINGLAGTSRALYWYTGNVLRWRLTTTATAEGGANAGSNFALTAYDDAGASLGDALYITRSNMAVAMQGDLTLTTVTPGLFMVDTTAAAVNNIIGNFTFTAPDSGGTNTVYGNMFVRIEDGTDGSEDGYFMWRLIRGGVVGTDVFSLRGGALVGSPAGGDKGVGTVNATDYYRAGVVVDPNVVAATYTPALTNTTNIAASTAAACVYARVGNVVFIAGSVSIDATAAGAILMGMSLPIASNLASTQDASGTAVAIGVAGGPGLGIYADSANDRLTFSGNVIDLANQNYRFTAMYRVL